MPPLEEERPLCPSTKYKFSEPQFAFSVKWGYSVLPDHADSPKQAKDARSLCRLYLATVVGARGLFSPCFCSP